MLVQAWTSKESSSEKEEIEANTRAMQCKKEDDVSTRRQHNVEWMQMCVQHNAEEKML